MSDQAQRVGAFLAMIESTREARTSRLLSDARDEAAAIVRRARAEARARVHAAVLESRVRSRADFAAARAELGTLWRKLGQEAHRAALAEGIAQLEHALVRRWRDPGSRRAWIHGLVEDALAILPRASWRIEHPPALLLAELADAAARIAQACGVAPEIVAVADAEAGFRIVAKAAVLDGTVEGLLARRTEVEARLLAEIDAEMEATHG